jgi:hypothetical protein
MTPRTTGIGHFTPLDRGLWLWEVSDSQMHTAREALAEAGLLICR